MAVKTPGFRVKQLSGVVLTSLGHSLVFCDLRQVLKLSEPQSYHL